MTSALGAPPSNPAPRDPYTPRTVALEQLADALPVPNKVANTNTAKLSVWRFIVVPPSLASRVTDPHDVSFSGSRCPGEKKVLSGKRHTAAGGNSVPAAAASQDERTSLHQGSGIRVDRSKVGAAGLKEDLGHSSNWFSRRPHSGHALT